MTGIPFGTIVLTDFPFTDFSAAKRRPALVVSTDNDRRTDVVVAFIISVLRAEVPDAASIAPTDRIVAAARRRETLVSRTAAG